MFNYIKGLVQKIKSSEKGQGMVEYALIIAFVAGIAIVVLGGDFSTSLQEAFGTAGDQVTAAVDTASGQQ